MRERVGRNPRTVKKNPPSVGRLEAVAVSGERSLWCWEGGFVAVCSIAAILSLRHVRKGGGDNACQHVPAGTAWHHLAQDCPRMVAEWRSGGVAEMAAAEAE